MNSRPTPAQTIGPFFHFVLDWPDAELLVDPARADAIHLRGRLLDGAGEAVNDALVEIWQADATGRYRHPEDHPHSIRGDGFNGFGRCATDGQGEFRFVTLKPGRVAGPGNTLQAPHLNMSIFARGLLDRLVTRVYFADEAVANAEDPVLGAIEDSAVRATLLAAPAADEDGRPVYRLDIRLHGEGETAFFSV